MNDFKHGLRSGIPIGLGYLAVSFSFGIMAVSFGFTWWQAVLISMLTVTSAGQLSAISTMLTPGRYAEMLISQFTINLRYSFMSVSLSQKTSESFSGIKRWMLGFFMTDEIFAVASAQKTVTPIFFLGLSTLPYLGWTCGTLLGSVVGSVLPEIVMNCLCLAIYGMFLAIILPDARKSKAVLTVICTACVLHCLFYYLPFLNKISTGIAISICAIVAATLGALLFPVGNEDEDREDSK